jgi:opacity protein-like surface antigen
MKSPVILVLVMLFCCGSLLAQSEKTPIYYLNTGVSVPSSPELFSRYWNPGPNFGFGLGFQATPAIALRTAFEYSNMPLDDQKLLEDFGILPSGLNVSGGSANVITAGLDFKANLAPMTANVSPYFVVGGGLFRLSASDARISYQGTSATVQGNSETAFGIGFGAGFDFRLNNRLALFLEGKYSIGFTDVDNTQYFPIKIGLAFR